MTADTITLELPLPAQVLHPNGRTKNHRYRAVMVKKARSDAALVGRFSRNETCPWSAATIHATFYMPRKRDDDGLIGWLKSYRDGLADAQIVLNDSAFRMGDVEQVTGKDAGRKVVLRIERRLG